MLTGSHRSERVGACTDCRRYWGKFRAEEIDAEEIADVNSQLVASVGTCSVMGTASTMACIAEALGMTVPGGASPPAVTADRIRVAERSGALAVEIARKRLTIDKVLTEKAFENAMRVLQVESEQSNDITDRDVFIFGQQRPIPSFAGFGPKKFFWGNTHAFKQHF
jgi:dihydroxy-acid dehydratase